MLTYPGRLGRPSPSSFASTAPIDGYSIVPSLSRPVFIRYVLPVWSPLRWVIERIRVRWLVTFASRGRTLLIFTPLTLVSMAPNRPPLGSSGLGSNVSIWLGPPPIHTRMMLG